MKKYVFILKDHLANYLKVKYAKNMKGDMLCLPVRSPFYRFVRDREYGYTRRSLTCPEGNLTMGIISLGNSKSSAWYYQLSKKDTHELERMIDRQMRQELHALMKANHQRGIPYVETVNRFMLQYDIRELTEDAFLRGYQRFRNRAIPE